MTKNWLALLLKTSAFEVVSLIVSFICGILIVRLLPVEEYAFFVLLQSATITMTSLANSGVAAGVMAEGGRVWKDPARLGSVFATGQKLRFRFAWWSIAGTLPFLLFLLIRNGASWWLSLILAASILPAFFSALIGRLLEVVEELNQNIAPIQVLRVKQNSLRLALTLIVVPFLPFAVAAILMLGISQIWMVLKLKPLSAAHADLQAEPSPEVETAILGIVKRVLPQMLFFLLTNQLMIWLIAIFGNKEALGKIGALERIAAAFAVVSAVFQLLIVPRFARLPKKSESIRTRFLQSEALAIVFCLFFLLGVFLFSDQLLWLLGAKYAGLNFELLMIAGSACGIFLLGATQQLLRVRGVVAKTWIVILGSVVPAVIAGYFFKLDTIVGVVSISIALQAGQLTVRWVDGLIRLK